MTKFLDTINSLTSIYVDVFGGDLLRYAIGAGGVYILINLILSRRLAHQQIGDRSRPSGQICREILASLRTVAIFAATGTSIVLGTKLGIFRIYDDLTDGGLIYLSVSVILLILLHDTWFYWTHRLMHYPPLFRRFHKLHHRSHRPTPFTSYSFDLGEAIVNAVYLPLFLTILPAHPLALLIFVSHMMLRNALAHCGYEVFPARPNGKPLFSWMTSVTHHDMHHAHAGKNLGFYFTWWDRLMGTEHPDYLEAFSKVAQPVSLKGVGMITLLTTLLIGLGVVGAKASDLSGRYVAPGLSIIVDFSPCETDPKTRCGALVWVWDAADAPHATIGEVILPDLRSDGHKWVGRLKSPQNGWSFKGSITPKSADRLVLRGCAGPFCVTQHWYSTTSIMHVLKGLR